ncbi:hypothetical protein [Desulfurivibrio dismutans]|uniref:hypothetical protein n=1 Tax=Desulfurivibrio dismutans TaxID=1398908 RepID=UPI0023DBEC42|nr:hypothetical protein [Desulfurivibrio alkaliphilus]MDF1613927.1 hypothetical protein [Desulfurivibrio alkaliphilus]
MECQRLQKLLKNWYLQVQSEAMAPGRMMAFMDDHLLECEVCLGDPKVREEADRIRAMIMPPVKTGKSADDESADGQAESDEPEDADNEDDEDLDEDDEEDEI